ncbi:MAG: divergent polysaccharide deacetylase family protein [Candidatus Cloacimonetes bacterium]|nr:divergent polysaccharide deacetylase family protein [Candidatus Cloacimonadota bacterium]
MPVKRRREKKKKNSNRLVIVFLIVIIISFFIYFISNFTDDSDIQISNKKMKKVETKQILSTKNISESIAEVVKDLQIPSKAYKIWIGEDAIYYYIGINKAKLDLNYANMLFTGNIEKNGGILLEGDEIGANYRQVITFKEESDDQLFTIRIYYAKPDVYKSSDVQLSIVVDDFGYYKGELLDKFTQLNPAINFAILPHLPHSKECMEKSVAKGHETLIHMPMEPMSYPRNNPGPNAIYVHQSPKIIKQKVEGYIKELNLCIGANNHMGSLVTADKDVMRTVLTTLNQHNLIFLDSKTTTSSIAYKTAQKMLMPSLENNFFLDTPDISEKTMQKKIETLKKLMKTKKQIVVITHCTDENKYQYLKRILKKIEKLDLEIVPLSSLFKNNFPKFY